MDKKIKITTSIDLNCPAWKTWQALTDKEMIRQYLWGTETNTDWKQDSPITFSGTWDGTAYEDKGFILKIEKEKLLKYSYWSSFSGTEFHPDNFSIVTFEIAGNGKQTTLSITQEGFIDMTSRDHSIENWNMVLVNIKKLLEQ